MSTIVSFSLPDTMIERIDGSRGDVSRSRFVLRLLEKAYESNEIKGQKGKKPLGNSVLAEDTTDGNLTQNSCIGVAQNHV